MEDRFLKFVNKTEECWLWTGHCGTGGYGQFKLGGKPQAAHRVAFRLWVGEIPAAAVIHHRCATKACVRPDHLQAVSHQDNVAEMMKRTAYEAEIATLKLEVERLSQKAPLTQRVKGLFNRGK
jgi:hypothetical protein